MREIKFKYIVKRKNGHVFSEIFTLKQIENGEALKFIDLNHVREKDVFKCQYTGLNDKNGKEIYKGDKDKDGRVVVWVDYLCAFELEKPNGCRIVLRPSFAVKLEIIGNIHETP